MVIEGIITTENSDGSIHVAPIGPHVDDALSSWTLKPFQSSTTFSNLRTRARGVFHVVDDALLMAASVLGLCDPNTDWTSIANAEVPLSMVIDLANSSYDNECGWVLEKSARIFALQVDSWDLSQPRAIANCSLKKQYEQRPMWGWNRAKHSILELSVIASRVHILDRNAVENELANHKIIIEKTAGPRELAAWHLLQQQMFRKIQARPSE